MDNSLVVVITLLSLYVLFNRKLRSSPIWHATVTPLASIIGSGFLVSAPLLVYATGQMAPVVMLVIVIFAYALGSSVRFNILHLEPRLANETLPPLLKHIEILSRPTLGLAYFISVAFYLKLLSAFIFRGAGVHQILMEKSLTTTLLIFIGLVGRFRGLKMLEWFEIYSVNTKLAIISAIIISLIVFNVVKLQDGTWLLLNTSHESMILSIRQVLGMLIIIQGFETSRYLGEDYSAELRFNTMKYAQWISGVIYVVFVSLSLIVFNDIKSISETSIIDICRVIAPIMPTLLIIAAVMSQFSAAIADTIGGGGLISETFNTFINTKQSYLLLTLIAVALTWLTNIYEIITIASKAFALYYTLQVLLTALLKKNMGYPYLSRLGYQLLALILILIVIFGLPVE